MKSKWSASKEIMEGKGEFNKRCNVTGCQSPHRVYYKHLSAIPEVWYCRECAIEINEVNNNSCFDIKEGDTLGKRIEGGTK